MFEFLAASVIVALGINLLKRLLIATIENGDGDKPKNVQSDASMKWEDEKPKRRGYFEIGDDGELIEVFEDEG